MTQIQLPIFQTYEEEATFWDNLDTTDLMHENGEWFKFETPKKCAIQVAILPEIADQLDRFSGSPSLLVNPLAS